MINKNKFFIWNGIYKSFEEARKDACGQGFSSDTYCRRNKKVTEECISALKNNKPIPMHHKQRVVLLPVVVAMLLSELKSNQKFKILDIGGGLGIGYMTLKESISEIDRICEYVILEVPRVCAIGEELYKEKFNIHFIDKTDDCKNFDLIFMSSTLQYIEDWKAFINSLSRFNAKYILLSDVFAGSIQTFATLQKYYESMIPHWFINEEELDCLLRNLGYRMQMKSYVSASRLNVQDHLPMDNFPESHRLIQTLHLLYVNNNVT